MIGFESMITLFARFHGRSDEITTHLGNWCTLRPYVRQHENLPRISLHSIRLPGVWPSDRLRRGGAEAVCVDCGLVVPAKAIVPGPEWRAFDAYIRRGHIERHRLARRRQLRLGLSIRMASRSSCFGGTTNDPGPATRKCAPSSKFSARSSGREVHAASASRFARPTA